MATKRKRGKSWEFVVRRSNLLDKPVSLTFETEAEGDAYCQQLENLLDRGIVPDEIKQRTTRTELTTSLASLVRAYTAKNAVSDPDIAILDQLVLTALGGYDLSRFTHDWADTWITSLKRDKKLAPSTIRHNVGALARALDYAVRQGGLINNPLRSLRKGYAVYSAEDEIVAGVKKTEQTRDERLSAEVEAAVLYHIKDLKNGDDLRTFFVLAVETGMRLSELFTLRVDNIHTDRKLVRLIKTKNGTTRDVPLSKVAIDAIEDQLHRACEYAWPWYPEKLSETENHKTAKSKTTNMLSTRWDKIFTACGATDYTFHYLRHEAASRIFENTKMPDRAIMKMFGWKSWEMVDRYSHLRASTLADYLD